MTPSQAVLAAAIESNSSQPSSAPPFSSSASLLPVSSPSLPSASEREVCKLGAEAHEPGDATRKRGQSPGEFDTDVCARCRFERGTHHEAERVGGVCASFVESTEGATPDSSQRSGVAGGGVVALGKRATGRAAESGAAERACEEAKSETGEGGPGEGGARASSGASAAAGPFSALVYLRQSHASMRVELVQLAALLDVLRRGPGSIAPAVIDSAVERAESALAGLTCAEQEVPLLEGLAEELNAATGREVWLREQLDAESDASERYLRDMERTRSENCDLRTQLSDATRRHSESTSNWLDKVAREQTVLREQAKALDALAEIVEASDDPLARARWRASGAKAARESFAALGLEVRQ